jgi:hypothetical protein
MSTVTNAGDDGIGICALPNGMIVCTDGRGKSDNRAVVGSINSAAGILARALSGDQLGSSTHRGFEVANTIRPGFVVAAKALPDHSVAGWHGVVRGDIGVLNPNNQTFGRRSCKQS